MLEPESTYCEEHEMRTLCFTSQLFLVLVVLGATDSVTAQSLFIKNVNVVDVKNEEILLGRNILIERGRIQRVFYDEEVEGIEGAENVDATGQYLIPGLWDMHVHWYETDYLPLYIAVGVTGIREMSGEHINYDWRKIEDERHFIGPKSIISSRVLDGPSSPIPNITKVANEEEAREQVRKYFEIGADLIKIYNDLSRESYFAIADESKKLGIPFAGHIPIGVSALEASDAGQKSIEHNAMINIATSDTYLNIYREYGRNLNSQQALEFQQRINDGYGGDNTRLTYEKLASNSTWVTPTLTVRRYDTFPSERFALRKEFLIYLPLDHALSRIAQEENIRLFRSFEQQLYKERQFEYHRMIVGDMYKAGVKLLAGTDGGFYCFPGCTIHDELELFVEAGLSPIAALKTATLNAAEYADKLADFGTVEEGKIADLVLLEANPLIEIENTRKIVAVVLNGILHNRDDLDRMFENVKNLPTSYSELSP